MTRLKYFRPPFWARLTFLGGLVSTAFGLPAAYAAPTATAPTAIPATEVGNPSTQLRTNAAQALGGQILIIERGESGTFKLVLDAMGNVVVPWTSAADIVPPGMQAPRIERLGTGFAVNTGTSLTPTDAAGVATGPMLSLSGHFLLADCLDDGTCLYRDTSYDVVLKDPAGTTLLTAAAGGAPIAIATKVGGAFHLVYEPSFNSGILSRTLAADGTLGPAHVVPFNGDHSPYFITPTPTGFTIFASGANDAAFYFLDAAGAPVGTPVSLPVDPNPCTQSCTAPRAERVGDQIVVRVLSNHTNSFVDNGDRFTTRYATFDLAANPVGPWSTLPNPLHPAGGTLASGFFAGATPGTLSAVGRASSPNGENTLAAGVVGGTWAYHAHRQAAVRYFDLCPAGGSEAWLGQLVAATSGAVQVSRITDTGAVVASNSFVLSALDVPRDLTLVEDGAGGAWVIALGKGYGVDTAAIVARRIDASGNPIGNELSWTIDAEEESVTAARGPGGLLVAWLGRDPNNNMGAIKTRTLADTGVLGPVGSYQNASPVYLEWVRVAWSGTHYLVAHRMQNGIGVEAFDANGVHGQNGVQTLPGRYPEIACRPLGCLVQTKLTNDDFQATRLWPDGTFAGQTVTYVANNWDASSRPPPLVWDGHAYASLATDTDCLDPVIAPDEIVWIDPVAQSVFSPALAVVPVPPDTTHCRYDTRIRRQGVAVPLATAGQSIFVESYQGVAQVRLVDNDHVALPAPPPPGTGGGGGEGGAGGMSGQGGTAGVGGEGVGGSTMGPGGGTVSSSAGTTTGGGGGGDGDGDAEADGGCGCRAAGVPSDERAGMLFALLAAAVMWRRRRS